MLCFSICIGFVVLAYKCRHSPKKVGFCVDNYVIYTHIGIVDVPTIEFVIPESTTYPHDDYGNLFGTVGCGFHQLIMKRSKARKPAGCRNDSVQFSLPQKAYNEDINREKLDKNII